MKISAIVFNEVKTQTENTKLPKCLKLHCFLKFIIHVGRQTSFHTRGLFNLQLCLEMCDSLKYNYTKAKKELKYS